ncbi:Uncharacterised protein [Klebsiella pneumoniae]|nr:Uncharacterised protein [Klebsiella pneumoniae]
MGWRNEDQPRRFGYAFGRAQAAGIHHNRLSPHFIHRQHVANAPVGRLLHPGEIAAVAQHAGDQVDGLVDPFSNKNLICLTQNAARYSQIVHQRVLQLGGTAVTAIAELFGFWTAADACLNFTEQRVGKCIDVRYAGDKRPPLTRAGADVPQQMLAATGKSPAGGLRGMAFVGAAGGKKHIGQRFRHESAAAATGHNVPLSQELFVNC